jgi:hypothetical protein
LAKAFKAVWLLQDDSALFRQGIQERRFRRIAGRK